MARQSRLTVQLDSGEFSGLPLAEQISLLEQEMGKGNDQQLLERCAGLADHDPLAWLCRALAERGYLAGQAEREQVVRLLINTSDTGVRKVLRALATEGKPLEPAQLADVGRLLLMVLKLLPFERLVAMCMVDRTCKQMFAPERRRYLDELVLTLEETITKGLVDQVSLDHLVQMPAPELERLRQAAGRRGAEMAQAFSDRCRKMVREAVGILEALPKAVSQANAEELLSRRVYSDPGHFLIELLQNAEDAGAVRWRVIFDRDRIIVYHNGVSFDIRDLVGVTSIGQTTKGKDQIGFFGVGFKAVYEVTGRPQVFSGDLHFEIADISIPRLLSQRPDDVPADGTVLVLPYRAGLDESRSPSSLYERAVRIDPCVLITLRRMEHIEFELTKAAGGPKRRAFHEVLARGEHQFTSTLTIEPDEFRRTYMVSDLEYDFQGVREAGKASHTGVMVGVHVSEQGVPLPLPKDAATVYSFLPTSEQSGLPFFVQGHFDLLVDRERISRGSEWNRCLLKTVPDGLKLLAQSILSGSPRQGSPAVGDLDVEEFRQKAGAGFLDILPITDELSDPFYRELVPLLTAVFRSFPCVPGAEGRLLAPQQVLIVDPGLAEFLGTQAVPGLSAENRKTASGYFAQAPGLNDRQCLVAASLGAQFFGVPELLGLLEQAVSQAKDEQQPFAELPFMCLHEPERALKLYSVLFSALERIKGGVNGPEGKLLLDRLRNLPLLLDSGLNWKRSIPGSFRTPARGASRFRGLFNAIIRFVHEAIDSPTGGEAAGQMDRQRASLLFDWLEVPVINEEWLLGLLETGLGKQPGEAGPLVEALLADQQKMAAILDILLEANPALQNRALALPLFPGVGGGRAVVARERGQHLCLVNLGSDDLSLRLCDYYQDQRAIADTRNPVYGVALRRLLEKADSPVLGIDLLLFDLKGTTLFPGNLERLLKLHQLLHTIGSELTDRVTAELTHLPIWPDVKGRPGSLRGAERILVPADPDISSIFPEARFLHPTLQSSFIFDRVGVERIGPVAAMMAFSKEAEVPLQLSPHRGKIRRVQEYLIRHADELRSLRPERLLQQPLFRSQSGDFVPADSLKLPADEGVLEFALHLPKCQVVDTRDLGYQLLTLFSLESKVPRYSLESLIDDIVGVWEAARKKKDGVFAFPPLLTRDGVLRFFHLTMASYRSLSLSALKGLLQMPLFPDEQGNLGFVRDKHGYAPRAVYPCLPEGRALFRVLETHLLDEEIQKLAWPILQERVVWADLELLVKHPLLQKPFLGIGAFPPCQKHDFLAPLHRYLLDRRSDLLKTFPAHPRKGLLPANPELNEICIWPTRGGHVIAASQLFEGEALTLLIEPGTPEAAVCAERALRDDVRETFKALQPAFAPCLEADVLRHLVQTFARAGEPLSKQSAFLSTMQRVAIVFQHLEELAGDDTDARDSLPVVNSRGCLVFRPLYWADPITIELLKGLASGKEIMHVDFQKQLPPSLFRSGQYPPYPIEDILLELCTLNGPDDNRLERKADGDYQTTGGSRGKLEFFGPVSSETTLEDYAKVSMQRKKGGLIPPGGDPARRRLFFDWLVNNEQVVFMNRQACAILEEARIFPTQGGSMVTASELLIEPPMADLPQDCFPGQEIPSRLLDILVDRLNVGKPPLEKVLEGYFLPTYAAAISRADRETAGCLFLSLARSLEGRPRSYVQKIAESGGFARQFRLEDSGQRFCPANELIWPHPDIESAIQQLLGEEFVRPSPDRYGPEHRTLLLWLGVEETPSQERLLKILAAPPTRLEPALGLTAVLSWLRRAGNAEFSEYLGLRKKAWLLDGRGRLHRPAELFLHSSGVESLIGNQPGVFVDSRAELLLGKEFQVELGIRGEESVELADICQHLLEYGGQGRQVSRVVYEWIERGLREQKIDPLALKGLLAGQAFLLTDDGRYWPPENTVGFRGFAWFGAWRGYWESGLRDFPLLFRVFQIPSEPNLPTLEGFLRELHERVKEVGDSAVLNSDQGLPHLLLRNYATLGLWKHQLNRDLQVFLCREIVPGKEGGETRLRLVSLSEKGLFLSDTPSLERDFAKAGKLSAVVRAQGSEQDVVDAFYLAQGIARLRESYQVVVERDRLEDSTATYQRQILNIRALIRSLAGVLPRVRLGRPFLAASGWQEERLALLGSSGSIRAIPQLAVKLVLPGVGEVMHVSPAVYDVDDGKLLLDVQILERPDDFAGELASGLLPCIYQGAGEEGLRDLLEILLPLKTEEAMYAYLDRRNFPVASRLQGPLERLGERLGQVLDFGWPERFLCRFPELGSPRWENWRHAGFLRRLSQVASLPENPSEYPSWIDALVSEIEREAGIDRSPPLFSDLLGRTLKAESLSDIPLEIFHSGAPSGSESLESQTLPASLEDILPGSSGILKPRSEDEEKEAEENNEDTESVRRLSSREGLPLSGVVPPAGVWGRFWNWITGEPSSAGNLSPLAPVLQISPPPTLTDVEALARECSPVQQWVAQAPVRLPRPWIFGVHCMAGRFSPESQSWSYGDIELQLAAERGEEKKMPGKMHFRARLGTGEHLLPMPMYSRLASGPAIIGGSGEVRVVGVMDTWGVLIGLHSKGEVAIEYTADLLPPPLLTGQSPVWAHLDVLLARTTTRDNLPQSLLQTLEEPEFRTGPDWLRVQRAADLICAKYLFHGVPDELPISPSLKGKIQRGKMHDALRLLHDRGEGTWLGKGNGYGLNVMLVEVLRHLSIPSLLARGYCFEDEWAAGPDRFFTLAVVGALGGVALFPVDGSRAQVARPAPMPPRPADLVIPPAPRSLVLPPEVAWNPGSVEASPYQAQGVEVAGSEKESARGEPIVSLPAEKPSASLKAPPASSKAGPGSGPGEMSLETLSFKLSVALSTVSWKNNRNPAQLESSHAKAKKLSPEAFLKLQERDLGILLEDEALAKVYLQMLRRGGLPVAKIEPSWQKLITYGLIRVKKHTTYVLESAYSE